MKDVVISSYTSKDTGTLVGVRISGKPTWRWFGKLLWQALTNDRVEVQGINDTEYNRVVEADEDGGLS